MPSKRYLFNKTVREIRGDKCCICGKPGECVTSFLPGPVKSVDPVESNLDYFVIMCQKCLQQEKVRKDQFYKELESIGLTASDIKEEFCRRWEKINNDSDDSLFSKEEKLDMLAGHTIEITDSKSNITDVDPFGTLPSGLSLAERDEYERRWNHYLNDFSFNDSSDMILLRCVILDELILKRLYKSVLENISNVEKIKNMNKEIKETSDRYRSNIESLNLSRKQLDRKGSDSFVDDVKIFDLQERRNFAEMLAKEEEEQMEIKKQRDDRGAGEILREHRERYSDSDYDAEQSEEDEEDE